MAEKNKIFPSFKDSKIILSPWITEASTRAAELNKYVFKVDREASKEEIKKAVENIFGVKVVGVNTIKVPKKIKRRARTIGFKAGCKKTMITLKEGDSIEFFEGK